jgi:hypothetical protein
MTVRSELDGLGPTEGPVFTWRVPAGFAHSQSPVGLPYGFTPGPTPAHDSGTSGWGTWLALAGLLLAIALVLMRTRSKSTLR